MSELEPTWPRVFAIWWLLVWRLAVVSLLVILVFDIAVDVPLDFAAAGSGSQQFQFVVLQIREFGLFWAPPIVGSVLVTRMALKKKKYRGFRIALIPPISTETLPSGAGR